MDLFLVLPVVLIVLVALWALVVKMVNDKGRRDDDDLPPTGGVSASDMNIINGTVIACSAAAMVSA
jgi:hypothetical protein